MQPSSPSALSEVTAALARRPVSRWRALLAIGAVFLVFAAFIFGNWITAIIPHAPFAPVTFSSGAYRATLSIQPQQPVIGKAIHVQVRVTTSTGAPATGVAVSYVWQMLAMQMGIDAGEATSQTGAPGIFTTIVAGSMGGSWQLQISIAAPGQRATPSPAPTTFTIFVRG
jgi:hypothetical protein